MTDKNMIRLLKRYKYILFFILLAGSVSLWQSTRGLTAQQLKIHFLNVGQGDATFIETPGGAQFLVDGGPRQAVTAELARVMPFWDRSIDVVLLTHPQLDHLSGLTGVLERYRIGHIMLTGSSYRLDAYRSLWEIIERKKIPVTLARAGERVVFDGVVVGEIISPSSRVALTTSAKDINEASVVVRLDYGETSVLLTGDAGFPTEDLLIAQHAPVDVDILKVGHHGSKYATSESFLKQVTPRVAVIEVGAGNTYGHPTPEVLARLASVGATVFRTDTDHTITLVSDGKNVWRLKRTSLLPFVFPKLEQLFSE